MEQLAAETPHTVVERRYSLITLVFFCSGLFVVAALFSTIPLNPVFMTEFHLTAERAALATSICSLCYALGTVVFAPLSDRYGRKRVIILGLLLLTVISPVIGFLSNYEAIIVFRGIQGFVAASFAPTALTFITELYPPKKRMTAIGVISAGFLMAGIVGQVYSSMINGMLGWHFVFYIFGLLYLGLAIAFIAVIPRDRVLDVMEKRSVFGAFPVVLSQSFFRKCYFITVLLLLSFVGMYTALENYLRDMYALEASQILLIRSAGMIGMLLTPFGGRLAERFGTFKTLRSGLALAAIGLFSVGVSNSIFMIACMSIVFTAGISITVPSLISLLGQIGGKEKASAMSLYSFFLFVGSTIGPMIAVFLMKTGNYVLTFGMIAALLTFGFLTTFPLAKKAAVRRAES
ncbi:MFS transporter [Bacillus sp. B190/17]|uniref:MFS transporter n=1 Tax=Bacillus lumedeiriae TaxID=3058829 RepID=A0ABW8I9E5_9BACI